MLLRIIIALMSLMFISACAGEKREDLRSPCVGAEGSPCDKRSVNDWWQA